MEEGPGPRAEATPGSSVLYSQALRSLMGGECLQILRCSICMEFFNIPIVLPCGHTFCLQCLTEMCRHATRSRAQNPLKDLLIGCPNCRVQIFAKPILERNVTCNFIIQSLIDMLRNRKTPVTSEACVNTDRSVVGAPVRAVSQEVLCGVLRDVDRLSNALASRSIVDDAFFEIDSLRRQYASSSSNLAATPSSAEPKPGASTPVASCRAQVNVPRGTSVTSAVNSNPLSCLQSSVTGVPHPVQRTLPRKAYSTALTSQPQHFSVAARANLPTGQPNQGRPGFRNKNRNNVDVAGRSPPEVATTGDGAHCIAKIFPDVAFCMRRRQFNLRPPPRLTVESSLEGCSSCLWDSASRVALNSLERDRQWSFDSILSSDADGGPSPPSIELNYRLARKRSETHSVRTRSSSCIQTEQELHKAESASCHSQRSPQRAKSEEATLYLLGKEPKSAKENPHLRPRKSWSQKGSVPEGSVADCCNSDSEVENGLSVLFDVSDLDLRAKDEDEARVSPLSSMFLNLSVEAREC